MVIRNETDKNSLIPIYHQIVENIKSCIQKESIQIGTMIPSEHELCDIFEVSRMTIRKAIDILVHEGTLVRQKGKGTFISVPKLSQPLTALTNFTKDMVDRGMIPTSSMLSLNVILASERVAKQLDIKENEEIIFLERIRFADGKPHAYECSYLLYPLTKDILDVDFSKHSLYETLVTRCNIKMKKAKEMIEVSSCSNDICTKLQIPMGSLTFHIERITYDQNNRPVEYVESRYRADKFKFYVELDLK